MILLQNCRCLNSERVILNNLLHTLQMSVEISPADGTGATAAPQKPQLELRTYPFGIEISSGARQYFFPYKTIQFLQLERGAEATGSTWTLHIRTEKDKINLKSYRDLDADFRAIMIGYRG